MIGTAREIRDAIVAGEMSAEAVLEETLAKIRTSQPEIHSFITISEEHAREQVRLLEVRRAAGEAPGPLWGVPFSVKDTYDTAGVRTTYGSRIYGDHVPERDAEIVARVRAAGGILVGKTNTPEFAIFIRTTNDLAPETRNPWDPDRTSGGSSGGAAASVGAGLTPIAIGSDGGGSVRIPAALCGNVGLLPSRGALPRGGGNIGTRRFSSGGPHALDARDAATLYRTMAGPSPEDGLSRGLYPTGLTGAADPIPNPRIRWVGESGIPGAETDVIQVVRQAAADLVRETRGFLELSDFSVEAARFNPHFYCIMQSDRFSTGGRDLLEDPAKVALLTSYTRHQMNVASSLPPDRYSEAIEMQLAALEHMEALLEGVDVVATPTLGFVAPEIKDGELGLPEDARRGFVAFTFMMNYTGLPAVTVPCGLVRGMPVGLQLIGRQNTELMLLDLAARFQDLVFRLPLSPIAAACIERTCR